MACPCCLFHTFLQVVAVVAVVVVVSSSGGCCGWGIFLSFLSKSTLKLCFANL